MSSEDAVWAGLFTAGVTYEVYCIWRKEFDRTASRTTRRWFRTHNPTGAALFTTAWMSFAAWYAWHIVRGGSNGQVTYTEGE